VYKSPRIDAPAQRLPLERRRGPVPPGASQKETGMKASPFVQWIRFSLFVLLVLAPALAQGQAPQQPAAAPPDALAPPPAAARGRGPLQPLGPATEPRPRDDARHQGFLEVAKAGNIDLLFVGDSITDWWRQANRGLPVWNEYFASLKAANFGIAGDTTQGVLWRMQNGELDGFQAKLIVLMLGTNNINRNPNDEIADGDRAIIQEFLKRQPQAKVLLLGIFPRGAAADSPFRTSIPAINARLATFADNSRIFYMDIGHQFLAPDGTLPADIMPDALHPSEKGYRIWADAIIGRVKELMQ
jgi:lysophospholipase L1-like esterase